MLRKTLRYILPSSVANKEEPRRDGNVCQLEQTGVSSRRSYSDTDTNPPRAKVYRAPHPFTESDGNLKRPSIYLAGPMDIITDVPWRDNVVERLKDLPIAILDPRRDDIEALWTSDSAHAAQVNWELERQKDADIIALYFHPGLKSPFSYFPLGLYAGSSKLIVCCPDGFDNKDEVKAICSQREVPLTETFEEFLDRLAEELKKQVQRGA